MNDVELALLLERERSLEYHHAVSRGITRVSVAILLGLQIYLGGPRDTYQDRLGPAATSQPSYPATNSRFATMAFGILACVVSVFWIVDEYITVFRDRAYRRALGSHLEGRFEELLIRMEGAKYYSSPFGRYLFTKYMAVWEPMLWLQISIVSLVVSGRATPS